MGPRKCSPTSNLFLTPFDPFFFDRFSSELNERQLRVLRRMLEEGPKGFKGGMSAKKYISMTQASKATATRDLQDLARRGIFVAVGGGRSTRYEIDLR